MNRVMLIGRLTRNPELHYSAGEDSIAVARYSLAVQRRYRREGEPEADFISCITFQKSAEFAEKYFRKGFRVAISGRLQPRSYTHKEGTKVSVTEVIVEEQEFADGKSSSAPAAAAPRTVTADGFMNSPDGMEEETPFS